MKARLHDIARALAFFALCFLLTVLAASILRTAGMDTLARSAIARFASALAATALFMTVIEDRDWRDVGLRFRPRHLSIGLAVGVAGALLVTAAPLAVGWARLLEATPSGGAALVGLIVLGSAAEEIGVRGYMLQVLMRRNGAVRAVLFTSLVFAAAHMGNNAASAASMANTFLAGAALGYAYWRSGSLWLPMGMHAAWNLLLPAFGANLSGFHLRLTGHEMAWNLPQAWSGGAYGPEGGWLGAVGLGAWLVLVRFAPVSRAPMWQFEKPQGDGERPEDHEDPCLRESSLPPS